MFCSRLSKYFLIFALVVSLLTACTSMNRSGPVYETEKLIQGFASAWASSDPDKLLSYYSEEVKSYDATAYGMWFGYYDIDQVLHNLVISGYFKVNISSYFISDDGSQAATFGTFAEKDTSGNYEPVPYVSLVKVDQGKIIWVFDYYGGVMSDVFPMQEIPSSASRPASAQTIADAHSLVDGWKTAYNERNIQSFIDFYNDQSSFTQVVGPEWRVLTKNALLQDMTSKFGDEQFTSSLADFFISADGHYAAVQGTYDDAKANQVPMVIILKMENGRIVEQYDYLIL